MANQNVFVSIKVSDRAWLNNHLAKILQVIIPFIFYRIIKRGLTLYYASSVK